MENWPVLSAIFGAIVALIVAWLALPKVRAEARKMNAETDHKVRAEARKMDVEADQIVVTGLYAEFTRLSDDLKEVKAELAQVRVELSDVRAAAAEDRSTAADEKAVLERENRGLRAKVERLTKRVRGLEEILKLQPTTQEMQDLIDDLDQRTNCKGDDAGGK